MLGLIMSFYLGFYIIMRYYQGSFKTKIRHSITAGLLGTKFVIVVACLLGIDKTLLNIRIGAIHLPITANLLLFISNLLATLSLNWEKIKPHFTITEEEYQAILEY